MLRKEDFDLVKRCSADEISESVKSELLEEAIWITNNSVEWFMKHGFSTYNPWSDQLVGLRTAVSLLGYKILYRKERKTPREITKEILAELGERSA